MQNKPLFPYQDLHELFLNPIKVLKDLTSLSLYNECGYKNRMVCNFMTR